MVLHYGVTLTAPHLERHAYYSKSALFIHHLATENGVRIYRREHAEPDHTSTGSRGDLNSRPCPSNANYVKKFNFCSKSLVPTTVKLPLFLCTGLNSIITAAGTTCSQLSFCRIYTISFLFSCSLSLSCYPLLVRGWGQLHIKFHKERTQEGVFMHSRFSKMLMRLLLVCMCWDSSDLASENTI